MSRIHQEVRFAAAPARVYAALTSSSEHAAFTGAPAELSSDEGGAFAAYGGHVHGRNIELSPGKRIVQAWRAKTWPEGVFSIARFELIADGAATRLLFEQDGVPEEAAEHIAGGWKTMYWEKLQRYLES
jgi:uncharacterized protein YndB with AHSA1/START domain